VQDSESKVNAQDSESELSGVDSEDLGFSRQAVERLSKTEAKRGPGRPKGPPKVRYGQWRGASYAEKRRLLADLAAGIPLPENTIGPRKGAKRATKKGKTKARLRD
jgi:hypothetical protein